MDERLRSVMESMEEDTRVHQLFVLSGLLTAMSCSVQHISRLFLEGFDDDLDYRKIQRISELLIMDVLQFLRKIEEVYDVGEEENSDNNFYTFEMKSIQEKLPKYESEIKAEDRKIRQEMEKEKKEWEMYERGSG